MLRYCSGFKLVCPWLKCVLVAACVALFDVRTLPPADSLLQAVAPESVWKMHFFSLLSPCAGGREEDSHRMWSWNHWLIIKSSAGLTHSPSQCYYCTIATLNLKHSKTVWNYNLPLLSNIQSDSPSSAWVETKSPTFPWQQKKHRNVTMAWSNGLVQCDLFADFCSMVSICSADSAGRCSLCFIPVLQQDWKISLELC